jgi:hypothetical protein
MTGTNLWVLARTTALVFATFLLLGHQKTSQVQACGSGCDFQNNCIDGGGDKFTSCFFPIPGVCVCDDECIEC